MKVALVHDYIKEFGGAERVLKVLTEMYPEAPIFTAFSIKGSTAENEFSNKKIIESWLAPILKIGKLYSPLRFLTPFIWRSFDLSQFDLVITSCSWYITRGFKVGAKTKVVAYCHTPPRWLYGYETSVGFTKYWPVKVYSAIVGHFMRIYDFKTAQKINHWIANSENVKERIKKFYGKEATVIYPPVNVESIRHQATSIKNKERRNKKTDYFLIVSRLVGAKGLEDAAKAFRKSKYQLKIAGESSGYSEVAANLEKLSGDNIQLMGRLDDNSLYRAYTGAVGFIALAKNEDFGITPVEAMAAGTPVIAFNGGGFRETVIDGKTGILINTTDEESIKKAIKKFEKINWDRAKIQKHAEKFSKETFIKAVGGYVSSIF